jgi:hypothetical protein
VASVVVVEENVKQHLVIKDPTRRTRSTIKHFLFHFLRIFLFKEERFIDSFVLKRSILFSTTQLTKFNAKQIVKHYIPQVSFPKRNREMK